MSSCTKILGHYKKNFTHYKTVNRADNKQVRYLYANKKAVKGMKKSGELPNGAMIVMEVNKAKLDANGNPIKGDDGYYIKDKIAGYAVMEKGKAWGEKIPKQIRNGDWNHAFFTPARTHKAINQAQCLACHQPLADNDYMFSYDAFKAKFAKR